MSKETAPAFQVYAAEYLADLNTQLMTIEEEGCYWRLMLFCWREASLPVDLDTLKALCKGVVPSNRVLSCFVEKDGRLLHPRLERERAKQAEWREKSAKGGRRSAHKPKHPKGQSTKQGGSTTLEADSLKGGSTLHLLSSSSSSPSTSSSTENKKDLAASQAQPPEPEVDGPSGNGSKPKDEAYEIWCSEFAEHRQIAYRGKAGEKGDFVQLAGLRRQLEIGTREIPKNWKESIHNYFQTPQGKYTLADLCSRYDVFNLGALDRFNKPREEQNGTHQTSFIEGDPGTTSDRRNSRGDRLYIPKQR